MSFRLKRIYDPAAPEDGTRILVDRLWPRGLRKADAAIDAWMKDIAPSHELRRSFLHDPARWDEFERHYHDELEQRREQVNELLARAADGPVTLCYAARDPRYNNAVALKRYLDART